MNIRFIAKTKDSVTLSRRVFDALMEELEDAQDLAAVAAHRVAKAKGEIESIPSEMVERMLAGENLVRLWREHRGMTARALADKAMVNPSYLSEIEGDHKPGSVQAMAKLARALGLQLDDLVRGDGREKARAKPSKNVFPKHVKIYAPRAGTEMHQAGRGASKGDPATGNRRKRDPKGRDERGIRSPRRSSR